MKKKMNQGYKQPAYPILCGLIAQKGIKKNAVAKAIGISPHTLSIRLRGESEFTISQALTIKRVFFPDMGVETLFKRNEA